MKYNALLSEFRMVFNQRYKIQESDMYTLAGLSFPRGDTKTQELNPSFISMCLEEYVRRMIGACACSVSIPSPSPKMWATPKRLKSLLTPTIRKRIKFVDRHQTIWADLQAYLLPVFEYLPAEDAKRKLPAPVGLRHFLHELIWDLGRKTGVKSLLLTFG